MLTELILIELEKDKLTLTIRQINKNFCCHSFETDYPVWFVRVVTSKLISKNPDRTSYPLSTKAASEQFLCMDAAIQSLKVIEQLEVNERTQLHFDSFKSFLCLFASIAWDYQQLIDKHLVKSASGIEINVPLDELWEYKKSYTHAKELDVWKMCNKKALKVWGNVMLNEIASE